MINSSEKTFEENNGKYGTINLNESTNHLNIALTQLPYIDGSTDEVPVYRAHGIDKEGNEYEIQWDVVENWKEIDDEQEMCNWDNPANVDKL